MSTQEQRDFLAETFAKIKADPKIWDQGVWVHQMPACHTVACLAGHGVLSAGARLSLYRDVWMPAGQMRADEVFFDSLPESVQAAIIAEYGDRSDMGPMLSVHVAARFLFGLTCDQACMMFASSNTMEMLEAMVEAAVNGTVWPEFDDAEWLHDDY